MCGKLHASRFAPILFIPGAFRAWNSVQTKNFAEGMNVHAVVSDHTDAPYYSSSVKSILGVDLISF